MIRRAALLIVIILITLPVIAFCAGSAKCKTADKQCTSKSVKAPAAQQKSTCPKSAKTKCEKASQSPIPDSRTTNHELSITVPSRPAKKSPAPKVPAKAKAIAASKNGTAVFDYIHKQLAEKNASKYEGVWAYTAAGKGDRTVIIKSDRNAKGQLRFAFLHQNIYSLPRFLKCSIDQYRANLYFMCKDNKPLMYSLVRTGQNLTGTVYTSWKDQHPVKLTKLTLPQAIQAMEKDYAKLTQLQRTIVSLQTQVKKQKEQAHAQAKKFEAEKLEIIARADKKVAHANDKAKQVSMELIKIKKSHTEATKQFKLTIGKLESKIGDLELKLKSTDQQLSKSQQAKKKLIQRNKDLKGQRDKTSRQNEKLNQEVENLRQELVTPEIIEESRLN